MSISFIKSDEGITVTLGDGFQGTILSESPKYELLRSAIAANDEGTIREICNPKIAVERAVERVSVSTGLVQVRNGVVYYGGTAIHSTLADRIIDMVEESLPIDSMVTFLANLMENPSYRAVGELYGFLEAGKMPITEDGCFLAYKRVRSDWKDNYSGTFDNSVGATCEMPRNQVDENANSTCSDGLHFCARHYIDSFYSGGSGSGRTIMVKINPADVVAIPTDYKNAKGRCCKYVVVAEIDVQQTFLEGPYYPDKKIVVADVSGRSAEVVSSGAIAMLDESSVLLEVYESARLAQDDTEVDASSIRKVCRGERERAGGYRWRWAVEVPGAINMMHTAQGPSFEGDRFTESRRPVGAMGFGFDPEDIEEFDEDDDSWNDDIPF